MNIPFVAKNMFDAKCCNCGVTFRAGEGFYEKSDSGFRFFCNTHLPVAVVPLQHALSNRRLTADFEVITPKEPDNLPILRSMPGARWNGRAWQVSSNEGDRVRVLELADRLGLDVDPIVRNVTISGRATAAKTLGLYQYQIDGVDFLSKKKKALLGDQMGLGKAQPLSSRILTPNGWMLMGDMSIGQEVINSNGGVSKVTGVFPQGIKDVFKVTFRDGATVRCCEEHLWSITTPDRKWRGAASVVKQLKDFRHSLAQANGNAKWHIETVGTVEFPKRDLPLDPYLMGYVIANGNLTTNTPRICIPDTETADRVRSMLPADVVMNKGMSDFDYNLSGSGQQFAVNPLTVVLRVLGLMGKGFAEKHIPHDYLYGSAEDRLAMFQGLMDGDGSCSDAGVVLEYSTGSDTLASQVVELVQSFGGVARLSSRIPTFTYQGEKKQGSLSYRINISLPEAISPFRLSRKADAYVPRTKYQPTRVIVSIEPDGQEECQCIMVDAPDHLYVTDGYVLTHNTVQSLLALNPTDRVMAVVPASLKQNWAQEIAQWRPDLRVTIIKTKVKVRWPEAGEIVIINKELLPEFLTPVKKTGKKYAEATWTDADRKAASDVVLIVDEAHKYKNFKAGCSKKMGQLSRAVRKVMALTGTPLLNKPGDLFGVLSSVGMVGEVFGSWDRYKELFNACDGKYGIVWGQPSVEVPERLRRVMLARRREEVLPNLPRKQYVDVYVDNNANITRQLDALEKNCGALCRQDRVLPQFTSFSKVRAEIAEDRIPAMLEFVENCEDQDEPLVVFSYHVAPLNALCIREGWAVITGDTPMSQRQDIVNAFQAGKLKGIGLTIQAGGVGYNMTFACKELFVDLDWVPANNWQAEDRVCIVEGEMVHTRRGFLPVELVETGDFVLTHKGNWKKVLNTHSREHRKLITEIDYTRYNLPLRSTHDHKLFVLRCGEDKADWLPAHQVLPGDFLVFPRLKTSCRVEYIDFPLSDRLPQTQRNQFGSSQTNGRRKPLPDKIKVTKELMTVFGFYLAEGFCSVRPGKGRFVSFSAHEDERFMLNDIANYLLSEYGITCSIYTQKKTRGIEMRCFSADLAAFFMKMFGTGSREKIIPSFIMDMPKDDLLPMVIAYVFGDGYGRNKQWEWTSVSGTVASQIAILMAKLGRNPCLRRGNDRWDGMVTIGGVPDSQALNKQDDDFVYNPVKSVRTSFAKRGTRVHDIEVEDDESFVVGMASVHNCRIGQESDKVTIYRMVSNHPLDMHVHTLLVEKIGLIEAATIAKAKATVPA